MKAITLAIIFVFLSPLSNAGVIGDELKKLGQAFSDNLATSDPGYYASRSRGVVSGGALRKRISHSTVSLVSITPPSFSAGCSGIDIHLGAFSFISGEEIRNMLRQIAQGVVSQAFMIAITQGCPICGRAIETVQEWANWANSLNVDTCQASQDLMEWAQNKSGLQNACASENASNGNNDDLLAGKAQNGQCAAQKSKAELLAEMETLHDCSNYDAGSTEARECEEKRKQNIEVYGNSAVAYLKVAGIINESSNDYDAKDKYRLELFSSIFGYYQNGEETPPYLSGSDLVELMLCGINTLSTDDKKNSVLVETCDGFLNKLSNIKMAKCNKSNEECDGFTTQKLSDFVDAYDTTEGVAFSKAGMIRGLGQAIISMQDKVAQDTGTFTTFETYLVTVAPFPLYRLVNLSASYPNVASELLKSNITSLSFNMVDSMQKDLFEEFMRGRVSNSDTADSSMTKLSKTVRSRIEGMLKNQKYTADQYFTAEQNWMRHNQLLTHQIIALERSLLKANLNAGVGGLSF